MSQNEDSPASVEPVTEHDHDNSWSANLEGPDHSEDRDLVISQAVDAIRHTTAGHHVNLVTHGTHGHPEAYLYPALSEAFDDGVEWEYVERCGCGGYLTSAHVK